MIGVVTLIPDEFRILKDNCLIDDTRKVGEHRFLTGDLGSQQVVFAQGIPDEITMSSLTQAMIDHFTPDLIFASSAAVTVVPFIETGDIIITNYFVVPQRNQNFDTEPNWNDCRMIETDSGILNSMRTAADALGDRDPQTVFGSILGAGESDLKLPRIKSMTRKMGLMAADRLGAAIAVVANLNGLPYIITEIAGLSPDHLEKYLNSDIAGRTVDKIFNLKLIAFTKIARSASVSAR